MVSAAVIQQPGKVELHAIPDGVPPIYLRFMRPSKPLYVTMKEYENISPTTSLDIETIKLMRHRVVGLSVRIAYWPDSWQDAWAIEELLKWEGRENEIRRDRYYADFIVSEDQSASENFPRGIESKSVLRSEPYVVSELHGEIHRRDVDPGADVPRPAESGVLRLERGLSGGYAAGLSGKDGE